MRKKKQCLLIGGTFNGSHHIVDCSTDGDPAPVIRLPKSAPTRLGAALPGEVVFPVETYFCKTLTAGQQRFHVYVSDEAMNPVAALISGYGVAAAGGKP